MQTTKLSHRNQFNRELTAPADIAIPFWPIRTTLGQLDHYQSTIFWFSGMKKATKKAYLTHLRLFCKFYSTDPDVLVTFPAEQLRTLLDAYILHLLKTAVKEGGKPRPGRFSVNSIVHYFTGLHSFFVDEHEKDINWTRYENKFPERVASNLRGYYRDEVQKLYKAADIYDKPLVLLEYCTSIRVGAVGPLKFEDMHPIPELPGFNFLKVYADSANASYYVVVTPEFLASIEALKDYRERWGEKVTGKSFLICQKKRWPRQVEPVSEDAVRDRMRKLALEAGVDITNIQPNHGMRKAGNTAMKNARVDQQFKEMLMGHSTGLDDVYYDIENPESRKEIVIEYMKAIETLTISDEHRLVREVFQLQEKLKEGPKLEAIQQSLVTKDLEINAMKKSNLDIKLELERERAERERLYSVLYEQGIIKNPKPQNT